MRAPKCKASYFDLLVLDVMMAGAEAASISPRAARAGGSEVPILMLTARAEVRDRLDGLESGVDGLSHQAVSNRASSCSASARSSSVPARPRARWPRCAWARAGFDSVRGELTRHGKPVRLTSSEAALLKLFAQNPGKPLSRVELTELSGASLERSVGRPDQPAAAQDRV